MFVGHFAAAFIAKRVEPRLPLWSLLLAAQLVDIAWGALILLGVEHATMDFSLPGNPLVLSYMPYTHSLPATILWAAVAGFGAVAIWAKAERRLFLGLIFAAVVASHWFLDLLVHRHDLGLWGNTPKVGLALWNTPLLAYGLEMFLLITAVLLLIFSNAWPQARRKALGFLGLGLALLQTATQFGAAPASLNAMVILALIVFLLVPLAGSWAERIR